MNRKALRLFMRRNLDRLSSNPRELQALVSWYCDHHKRAPMSAAELRLSERIVSDALGHGPALYHGGVSGLRAGELLLPAKDTGQDPRGEGGTVYARADYVYFTTCPVYAAGFAAQARGCIYRVQPIGPAVVDVTALRRFDVLRLFERMQGRALDWRAFEFKAFACDRAEVLGVLS